MLAVTLQLLQQNGYDGLTVDDVAAVAHASKATMYRRWPTKADLVLAAFIEGISQVSVPPDTGSLRGDLLAIGQMVCSQVIDHAGTVRAVLGEFSRNPAFNEALQRQFLDQRKALIDAVLQQAVDRGEITPDAVNHELWDLLPGYMIYRSVIQGRLPTMETVQMLVDEVILPSLTRRHGIAAPRGTVQYCSP